MRGLTKGAPLFGMMLLCGLIMGISVFAIVPLASKNVIFIFAIPVAFMYVLVMALRPGLALALLISVRSLLDILLVHTKVDVGSSDAGIGALLNLLIIFQALLLMISNIKLTAKLLSGIRIWQFFLFVCVVSVAFSPDAVKAIKVTMQQVAFMLIFLLPFFIVKEEKDKKFWLKVILISSLMPVGLANIAIVTHMRIFYTMTPDAGWRLQGSFTHPNILAFYLTLVIVTAFYFLKTKAFRLNNIQKWAIFLYMLNLIAVLVITKTRSALLACILVFIVYGFLKEKKYIVIVLIAGGLLCFTPQVQERLSGIFNKATSRKEAGKNSFDWRLKFWASSMPLIKQRPVFGRGLASFRILSPTFSNAPPGIGIPAHNVYVQLLFETGILGLCAYIGIFLQMMRLFYKKVRERGDLSAEAAVAFAFVIGYLVVCFSDNILDYVAFNWYFFFFLGLTTVCMSLPEKNKEVEIGSEAETEEGPVVG